MRIQGKIFISIVLVWLMLVINGCNNEPIKLGDYSEFDLQGVKDLPAMNDSAITPSETAAQDPNAAVTCEKSESILGGIDQTAVFSCDGDSDCLLIQPAKCCACPLAISRYIKKDIQTVQLGTQIACEEDYLCGVCPKSEAIEAKCISGRCTAIIKEKECPLAECETAQDTGVEEMPESYPIPDVPEDSDFKSILIKKTCQPGTHYNAVYFGFGVKTSTDVFIELRESQENEFVPLMEFNKLYEVEQTIAICDGCRIMNTPTIQIGKKYELRLRSESKDKTSYSGVYILDTRTGGEYVSSIC